MNERDAIRQALRQNPKMARMLRKMMKEGKLTPPPSDPNEPIMVLCKRWPGLVDNCRMALCSFCAADVALAPSSQELIDATTAEVKFCCMECYEEGTLDRYQAEQKAKEDAERKLPGAPSQ